MALTRTELQVIQRFLESPRGTAEEIEALDELILLADARQAQWDARTK